MTATYPEPGDLTASDVLDRMEAMTRDERLIDGRYMTGVFDRTTGAICGGTRACLVGTMWIAAAHYDRHTMVGGGRAEALQDPVLAEVFDAFNAEASLFAADERLGAYSDYELQPGNEAEGLFEGPIVDAGVDWPIDDDEPDRLVLHELVLELIVRVRDRLDREAA